jgi:hypothetical protein
MGCSRYFCFRRSKAGRTSIGLALLGLVVQIVAVGCSSPYNSDRGALVGGLGGAGVGALVGGATRHPVTGALVGAGVGAVSGGLVGGALDNIEAKNRAQIAAQMGRPLPPGGVQVSDVVAMNSAGVQEELIVNHVRNNGMAQPLQAGDLITLQQQGISTNIISTMQNSPPRAVAGQGMAPGYAGPAVAGPMMVAPAPGYYYPAPAPYWGVGF